MGTITAIKIKFAFRKSGFLLKCSTMASIKRNTSHRTGKNIPTYTRINIAIVSASEGGTINPKTIATNAHSLMHACIKMFGCGATVSRPSVGLISNKAFNCGFIHTYLLFVIQLYKKRQQACISHNS